jgi:hypothetical protein
MKAPSGTVYSSSLSPANRPLIAFCRGVWIRGGDVDGRWGAESDILWFRDDGDDIRPEVAGDGAAGDEAVVQL